MKTTLGYHCEQCGSDCVFKTYVFLDIDGNVFNDD